MVPLENWVASIKSFLEPGVQFLQYMGYKSVSETHSEGFHHYINLNNCISWLQCKNNFGEGGQKYAGNVGGELGYTFSKATTNMKQLAQEATSEASADVGPGERVFSSCFLRLFAVYALYALFA